jgi:hypothetical protein
VTKSRTSIDNLVATVSERLASRPHIQRIDRLHLAYLLLRWHS